MGNGSKGLRSRRIRRKAISFTEFYCDAAAGSNVNAGDKTANGVVTSTNGAWSSATNIFVATGGTPFSGVTAGDFCSLMLDGGTVAVYTARVTNVGSGGLTLTLSSSAFSGSVPSNAANGVTATTGGAWKGPNGAVNFPFGYASRAMNDGTNLAVRINLKNNSTYSVTASIQQGKQGLNFEGYTSSPGDGGVAVLDGGTSGSSYNLLSNNEYFNRYKNLEFRHNGASGSDSLVTDGGYFADFIGCIFHDCRGIGLAGGRVVAYACEFYNCNQSATSGMGGAFATFSQFSYCTSHDNTGYGISINTSHANNCVLDSNSGVGILMDGNQCSVQVLACDFYNNGSHGIDQTFNNETGVIINCNFVKNGGYGVAVDPGPGIRATLFNCGFGSGSQANASGQISSGESEAIGTVTYASNVTPWVDPANGDFRINLTAAKGTGRGAFTQTASSYAGTIGYPDIGAAQHQDSGGGGAAGGSYTFCG